MAAEWLRPSLPLLTYCHGLTGAQRATCSVSPRRMQCLSMAKIQFSFDLCILCVRICTAAPSQPQNFKFQLKFWNSIKLKLDNICSCSCSCCCCFVVAVAVPNCTHVKLPLQIFQLWDTSLTSSFRRIVLYWQLISTANGLFCWKLCICLSCCVQTKGNCNWILINV